ncbi:CHAT domain-containing protein [Tolypothrix sp. FACHB-123]|uniref:CHAT domain-containing tetratricopeptide repeat protein n=1 Tax=Tolypothrix sp. FACHB-123 TaxID=2692868 RepID=UPI001687210E|nr:CHAT domain-containing tetratricopeptide repeat protein [Tolypothrix sp. FACHB-123]MBD2354964.1 CHAT domain-containing protein [Tolypothrix sp. FACHB-123]
MLKLYTLTCLLSVVLLSESVGANATFKQTQIAQQPATIQQDANRDAAQKAFDEGMALYEQGTAESRRQAIEKWQQALILWRKAGDKKGEAVTFLGIGRVYDDLGEKQKALEYYNNALPLWRAVGNRGGEATTLNNIGGVYSALGEQQKALEFYNNALPLIRAVGDRGGEATTLVSIGAVYNALGEQQKALEYYNNALPLIRAVGDRGGEAITLNNIGAVYNALGENQKALEYYNNALPLIRAVGDRGGEAITLNNIGAVYNALGENQKALEYYNNALPLIRAVGDRGGEAITLNNIGAVYNELGESQKALEYYNNALPLRRAVGDRGGEASTLNNIGGVYNELGESQKALEYYNNALPLIRAVGDRGGEASTLNNLGLVYSALGENQKALEFYNNALPLWRAVGDRGGEATTLNNIGLVYSALGENQKALEFYNNALPLLRAVGDRGNEANLLGNIAYVERSRGNLQAARTNVEAAIKIIEQLRTKIDSKDLRTSYFATQQGVYKFYIDLLMELHKKSPSQGYAALALHYSERSRARSLIELLNEANAKILKGANPELLAQEQDLRQQIDAKDTLRINLQSSANKNDPITKAAIQKLTTEIENLLNQYQEIQAKIRTSNPAYAKLKNPDPDKDILKLPQIQQQLDQDTLLLQYSLGEERSFLWVVSSNSLDTYELPKQQDIEKSAINLFCLISQNSSKPPSATDNENPCTNLKTPQINVAAKELTQLILSPAKDKLGKKRLVIVADGALQYIPFAALTDLNAPQSSTPPKAEPEKPKEVECSNAGGIRICSQVKPQNWNYQPLVVNHEIVSLPSASSIAFQRQQLANRQPASKALAILADPVYSVDDPRLKATSTKSTKSDKSQSNLELELERSALERSARSLNRNGWQRLVNTATEAKEILKFIPAGSSLEALNFDANYNWATSKALNQFRILHFATHGFVNQDQPALSGIVLSLVNQQGQAISGYLRLADLFNQDYPAELIVLSACETGLGKNINGEGLVGLTRGLMYAGAARVAVSLWQVSDRGTSILMQEFYKQMLQQNKKPAEALRAAQLKLWQEGRSPYEWAAFTLQGEWR